MKKSAVLPLLIVSLISSARICRAEDVQAAVDSVVIQQCEAWNKGDLDAFMSGYLDSEETSFSSGGILMWGIDTLKERYIKTYGDSRETMGKLEVMDLKVIPLGAKSALCIGHWHLDREKLAAVDGVFSLVFVKRKEGWKIIHDHSSAEIAPHHEHSHHEHKHHSGHEAKSAKGSSAKSGTSTTEAKHSDGARSSAEQGSKASDDKAAPAKNAGDTSDSEHGADSGGKSEQSSGSSNKNDSEHGSDSREKSPEQN